MDTFDSIVKENRLLYSYYRGSFAYGTYIEGKSDMDEGGVYCEPLSELLSDFTHHQGFVSDERGDKTWWSLDKFFYMLMKSNPSVLEGLFIPDRCVIFENPVFTKLKENRDFFLSKQCFGSMFGFAQSQIGKARGLKKKIANPIEKRLSPYDFAFVYDESTFGSIPLMKWLSVHGYEASKCGASSIPHFKDTYQIYYDVDGRFGYCGLLPEGTDEMRLSSIPKTERPICIASYSKDAYSNHCSEYRQYQEWKEKRNPVRYKENCEIDYDRKKVMHCLRILRMGRELAETGELRIDRTGIDADFLLSVRLGEIPYDEIISVAEKERELMNAAVSKSKLKDKVDDDEAKRMLLSMRKELYWLS